MIKTFVKDGKTYASIEALFRWDKNPKLVLKDDFKRLVRYIKKHGLFKPLLIMENGEVVGGNTRLVALQDLGYKDVWVEIVHPKDEADKLELSLADNDEVGKYIEEDLAQLIEDIGETKIDLKDVKINIGRSIDLKSLLEDLGPSEEPELPEPREKKPVTCPECGHEFIPE